MKTQAVPSPDSGPQDESRFLARGQSWAFPQAWPLLCSRFPGLQDSSSSATPNSTLTHRQHTHLPWSLCTFAQALPSVWNILPATAPSLGNSHSPSVLVPLSPSVQPCRHTQQPCCLICAPESLSCWTEVPKPGTAAPRSSGALVPSTVPAPSRRPGKGHRAREGGCSLWAQPPPQQVRDPSNPSPDPAGKRHSGDLRKSG